VSTPVVPLRLLRRRKTLSGGWIYPIAGVQYFYLIRTPDGWATEWCSVAGKLREEQAAWLATTGLTGTLFPRLRDLVHALQEAHQQLPCPLDYDAQQRIRLRRNHEGYAFRSGWVQAKLTSEHLGGNVRAWRLDIWTQDSCGVASTQRHVRTATHLYEARVIIDHYLRATQQQASRSRSPLD
jgi:hypothetical protein